MNGSTHWEATEEGAQTSCPLQRNQTGPPRIPDRQRKRRMGGKRLNGGHGHGSGGKLEISQACPQEGDSLNGG